MLFLILTAIGCDSRPINPIHAMSQGTAVLAVDLSVPTHPQVLADGVNLSVAKNAWSQWALQLDCSQLPAHAVLRLPAMPPHIDLAAYQVLPAPVDLNDAGYIRQTGDRGDTPSMPRALLPLQITNGAIDLAALRDPSNPCSINSHPAHGPVLIWIDLHTTAQTAAGTFTGECQLLDSRGGESAGSVALHATVEDITLPVEPHLHFAAALDWVSLATVAPHALGPIAPRLLSRLDPRDNDALDELDAYIRIGHQNRVDVFVPRIQPIVKWPLGKLPEVDWSGFDSVATRWFTGRAFADHVPIGFWPLPAPDSLSGYDLATQVKYWHQAAEHFDQRMWLDRSPVLLKADAGGTANDADSILLSAEARQILSAHPRIGALLPMQDDQIQLASPANSAGVGLDCTSRLYTAAPGLVSPSPIRDWPDDALPPRHWIDAGTAELTPHLTTEQGIRSLAWQAFSRDASLVLFGNALPVINSSNQPARADRLPLFYPGQWYGTDAPLQTLSLKWIRQAAQDYEYLFLASQHGDHSAALKMCQLITRPVQLLPAQPAEPVFELLANSDTSRACEEARALLVNRLLHRSGTVAIDPVELQTLRWFEDRQNPSLVGSAVRWMWNLNPQADAGESTNSTNAANLIDAVLSVDLYNPADSTALGSVVQCSGGNSAWQFDPDPAEISPLARYQVRSIATTARFNLNNDSAGSHDPIQLSFIDSFNSVALSCRMMLPVAVSPRRTTPIRLDGSLEEWFPADAIQLEKPLVKMLDRSALQSPELQLADQPASIYSAWSDDNFYLAFRLAGVTAADLRSTRNFVIYDHGRAWGEDLCEMLITPIYTDNSTGPTLHIVAKPGGNWVEQQTTPTAPWQPFEASGVRYASSVDPTLKIWRGETAIPWRAIQSPNHARPALLRFNFIQHRNDTGESASWAGPIDQSRDGKIAGLLVLKEQ